MAASIILSPFSIPITHRPSHRTTGYYLSATVAGKPHLNCSHKPVSPSFHNLRRRQILLSCTFPALLLNPVFFPNSAAAETENTRGNELIQKLLEKSKANKAKYDKERLDDYYKRNYKEYFEFVEGSIQNKKGDMSEAEKGIIEWLRKNR